MATRKQPTQVEKDANEFGVGVRCGGWRLGLLVARNVAPGKAGRPKSNRSPENENEIILPENEKLSMNAFAELASVSPSHVKYYFDAWDFAAQAGLVPKADQIVPGDEEVCIDVDAIEDEENAKTHWTYFYQMAKNPPEKPKKQRDSDKQEKQSDPVAEQPSDDSIDEDFGVADSKPTKDELAEADSSIQRNELLEILESIQALTSRLVRVDSVLEANKSLVNQIGSAAMDLSTTALSMASTETVEKVEA